MNEIDLQLIEEIIKAGREFIYDKSKSNYKNGYLRQRVWAEIVGKIGIEAKQCQDHWKALRAKYVKMTKLPRSGSAGAEPSNAKNLWVVRALDFLKCQMTYEPTESSLVYNISTDTIVPTIGTDPFGEFLDETADEGLDVSYANEITSSYVVTPGPQPTATSKRVSVSMATTTKGTPSLKTPALATPSLTTPALATPVEAIATMIPRASGSSKASEPPNKKRITDENPFQPVLNRLLESIGKHQNLLAKQTVAPCFLKTFAEKASDAFNKWTMTRQVKFISCITDQFERENEESKYDYLK